MTKRTHDPVEEAAASIPKRLARTIFPGLLALGACQEPRAVEPKPQTKTSAAVAGADCDVSGLWELEETPQAAHGCAAGGSWAPFVDAILEVEQPGGLLKVAYVPEDGAAMSCSGVPAEDGCALEMTCTGTVRGEGAEASLELTFAPRTGTLSGTRTLHITETGCSMTVSLESRRRLEPETDDG